MAITVRPVTGELWPALEDLFGQAGASNGCWCMYWRLGPAYRDRPREQNKAALRALTRDGPPPGLLASDTDVAVGWCQLTPRADLPWLSRLKLDAEQNDEQDGTPAWSLSCFYIRRGHRGRGIAAALIDAALTQAKRAGAPALEAYPIDTAAPGSTANTFTGTAGAFRRAGFVTVASRPHGRLIMRHDLRSIS